MPNEPCAVLCSHACVCDSTSASTTIHVNASVQFENHPVPMPVSLWASQQCHDQWNAHQTRVTTYSRPQVLHATRSHHTIEQALLAGHHSTKRHCLLVCCWFKQPHHSCSSALPQPPAYIAACTDCQNIVQVYHTHSHQGTCRQKHWPRRKYTHPARKKFCCSNASVLQAAVTEHPQQDGNVHIVAIHKHKTTAQHPGRTTSLLTPSQSNTGNKGQPQQQGLHKLWLM